ncbi:MAG: DUF885 domain-containing protein [Flavobacteriia bacterium]|nr:DUF885 domain-containing protein [Bacteroidota bacterium]MDA1288363.1 DUF885 domain-containing protein [Bacteroidota bacterium]NDE28669.1 DUF885 domain-containing protein [Flavobacteriia bacterium]
MRKILITFGSLLWVMCQNPTKENKLTRLITAYESYEQSDNEQYPLGDYSEQRFEQYAQFCDSLKNELNTLDYKLLNEEDQISYSLLDFVLNEAVVEYQFKTHWNPILSDAGFHSSLTYRVRPLTNKKSALIYLRTLEGIPTYIKQQKALIEKGLEAGMGQPLVIFKGYESTYNQHITSTAEENFFYSPFLNLPTQLTEAEKDSLQAAAKTVVVEKVIPAFEEVKNFFEQEYFLRTRKTLGVSEIPNGKAYYQSRIDYYTTQQMTPEGIHSLGLSEVARIRSQMESIIDEVGFKGTFDDFIAYLRTSPKFYATTPEMLLKHARNIAKKLDEQLPRYFITLPRKPYGVAPVPASIAPKYTGGRYVGSPKNSTDPGYYWVNTYNLSSRPLYVIPSLTAHEAVPGHHLQGALNQELPDHIPQFRKNLYLSAYGEGWGLYTEYLAEEMGIYETPYEHFGKLTYEMWRACRLVVDTGIHAFGWSRDQAVTFMASNTALSLHEVNTEIDRYISWPGQALSYKIGEIKIRELREKAMKELGSDFDIREFHEEILKRGTLTLPLLENQILNYINRKKQKIQ